MYGIMHIPSSQTSRYAVPVPGTLVFFAVAVPAGIEVSPVWQVHSVRHELQITYDIPDDKKIS
jgi:hypothetical protein